jgi:type IV secretion system protein TrbJ
MTITKKYFAVIIVFVCLSIGVNTPLAHAGIPVIDVGNLVENIISAIESIEEVINTYTAIDNQITQIENQVKSLYNQAKNLQKMDLKNSLRNLGTLRGNLSKVKQLALTTKALPLQAKYLESRYDSIYKRVDKSFNAYTGMSLDELKQSAVDTLAQTSESVYDAMQAQGFLFDDIEEDEETMEDLLANSDDAEGALEATQVNTQMVALNTNQLIRLQTINAVSARMQASKQEEEVQRKLMTEADSDRYYEYLKSPTNTLDGSGDGQGFVDFK